MKTGVVVARLVQFVAIAIILPATILPMQACDLESMSTPTGTLNPEQPSTSVVVSGLTELPTSEPIPYYLKKVFPKPDSTIHYGDYDPDFPRHRGICVRLLGQRILDPGDSLNSKNLTTWLKIDREFVEVMETTDYLTNFETADGATSSGPYDICGVLDLLPGDHEASFIVQKLNGEKLEYSWWFRVISNSGGK